MYYIMYNKMYLSIFPNFSQKCDQLFWKHVSCVSYVSCTICFIRNKCQRQHRVVVVVVVVVVFVVVVLVVIIVRRGGGCRRRRRRRRRIRRLNRRRRRPPRIKRPPIGCALDCALVLQE